MPLHPGPAQTKLTAAVEAIENLEMWKADFEASMHKTQKFFCTKINILDETVKIQAEQSNYLEEILEIEWIEERACVDGGRGPADENKVGMVMAEGDVRVRKEEIGAAVKTEDTLKVSKELDSSKQIKVSLEF